MNIQLTHLECKALEVAFSGDNPWFAELRTHIPRLRVVARQYTGVGFYSDFECEGCVTSIVSICQAVPVAWAGHPDVENGAMGAICFNVFLRDGKIVSLEGASVASWPVDESKIIFAEDKII